VAGNFYSSGGETMGKKSGEERLIKIPDTCPTALKRIDREAATTIHEVQSLYKERICHLF
jgi:hypothetical protein